MVLSGRQALINGSSLVLLDAAELARHLQDTAYAPEQLIYLGSALPGSDLAAGTELVLFLLPQQFEVQAEEFEAHIAGIPEGAQWAGFRDVAATLNPTDTAIFIEASAIANWHATHTHCPRCGTATAPEAGGWVRRCPADGSEHYPRTDPAIIVTVVGPDGRLLLGGGGPLTPGTTPPSPGSSNRGSRWNRQWSGRSARKSASGSPPASTSVPSRGRSRPP